MATPTTVPWGWFYAWFNEANTEIYHPPYGGAKIYHPQFLGVPNHRLIILGVVNNIFAQNFENPKIGSHTNQFFNQKWQQL